MRSPLPKVWDAPAVHLRGLRYREATLRLIFDRSEETTKRPGVYTLGRIRPGSKSPDPPSPWRDAIISKVSPNNTYEVVAPGSISEDGTRENCLAAGLKCSNGAGTDTDCSRNKCVIGQIEYDQSLDLWRYESINAFKNAAGVASPLQYYTESKLKNNPSFYCNGLTIDAPATMAYDIVPPMELQLRGKVRVDVAMRAFAEVCRYREACIESHLLEPANERIRLGVLSHAHGLGEPWQEYISNAIGSFFYDELSADELLDNYLDTLDLLRDSVLLVKPPRYKKSRVIGSEGGDYARPIYSRLPESYKSSDPDLKVLNSIADRHLLSPDLDPGAVVVNSSYTEAYQYLPRAITNPEERLQFGADPLSKTSLFSPADLQSWRKVDPPSPPLEKWVSGGVDKLLSDKKLLLDQFYHNYLDPRTCDPQALDWVRMFFGFTDGLWDERWEDEQKRTILMNAFGWFDDQLTDLTTRHKTLKGEVCSLYNMSLSPWVDDPAESNYHKVVWHKPYLSELTTEAGEDNSEVLVYAPLSELKIDKSIWRGLHETKGTKINMIWWIGLFKIIGCDTLTELEGTSNSDQISIDPLGFKSDRTPGLTELSYGLRVRTNLDVSVNSRLSRPIIVAPTKASDMSAAPYIDNPLVAGHTQLQNETIFVLPISFRYSRYSRVWEDLEYIVTNWGPANTKVRAQYQYPAADYVVAGDVFFDGGSIDE